MRKILYATLEKAPGYGVPRFNWHTCCEAENSHEWGDNLHGYLSNLDLQDRVIIPGTDCEFTIYDIPWGAFVIVDEEMGAPYELYWVLDVDGEWFFPDDAYAHSIFGGNEFCCLNRQSIAWLAREWAVSVDEIMEMMHEATVTELSKYGIDK